MNGKTYLVEYMVIVAIMMVLSRSAPLENTLIVSLIVLIQIGFDRLRRRR